MKTLKDVKVGQTVKKGDLLISGVIPTELGGGAVRASGVVKGRYSEGAAVSVPKNAVKRVLGARELCEVEIKIFGFSINIFQRYRNFDFECDIIEEKSEFCFNRGKKLPITVLRRYCEPIGYEPFTYSSDELCAEAGRLLREKNLALCDGRELLRIRTHGEFTDDGYFMSSELILSGEVGMIREFELEIK